MKAIFEVTTMTTKTHEAFVTLHVEVLLHGDHPGGHSVVLRVEDQSLFE